MMMVIQPCIMLLLGKSIHLKKKKFFLVKIRKNDSEIFMFIYSNQPEVMELLIKKGAIIDSTNRGRCTPLHVAVNKQFPVCVQVLLKYGCDVNVQVSRSKYIMFCIWHCKVKFN